MMESYPYSHFIQKNWLYIKDKPLAQSIITPQSNIDEFRARLIDIGVEVDEDIIDWRIYALLMFSVIARRRFKASPNWIPEQVNITRAEECYNLWDAIESDDRAQHFYNFKKCIEDDNLDVLSKVGLLLRCKFELHIDTKNAAYLPMYLSLYARVVKNPKVLNKVVTNHRAWGVLSSLHHFPVSVSSIDYAAFPNRYNWFLSKFFIISNLLDEE